WSAVSAMRPMIGILSSASFSAENFAGMVCPVAPIGACDPAPALRSTLVLPVLVLSAAPANVTALKSASAITPWRRELRMGASFAVYGRKENARQAETLPV